MKAVELFCGIGGFRLACDQQNIRTIFANDMNDHACSVYQENFGSDNLYHCDLNDVIDEVPDHQLLTGGFPCQPFSSAGKKRGVDEIRGTLFESIARVLRNNQPAVFVLENVKRLLHMDKGRHFKTILATLTEAGYSVEWALLDSCHFSLPQARERVFLVGFKGNMQKLAFLGHYLGSKPGEEMEVFLPDKAAWNTLEKQNRFNAWGIAIGDQVLTCDMPHPTFGKKKKLLRAILEKNVDEKYFFNKADTEERIKNSDKVDKFINGVEVLYNQKGGARMGYTIFGVNGIAPTLTGSTSRHYERYQIDGLIRRLTPNEYARIQGFPDGHCSSVNDSKQYILYGNAVPPQMAEWVIKQAKSPTLVDDIQGLSSKQARLF